MGLKDFLLDLESAMVYTFVSRKALDNVEVPHVNGQCLTNAACSETYPNGDFSCEVKGDGRVIIKGVTVSGERRIEKYKQTFEMLTQNLCSAGAFSISFKLPGPVDLIQFQGNFGTDGILEGIALKATR